MRWRISAAVLDSLIVYGAYLVLCAVRHWRVASVQHAWVPMLGVVAYHFAMESRDGRTVGKRIYGVEVRMADGGAPSVRAVAVRSLLRIIDQLPIFYASGMVSLVRTGPARRQRIGDVVAGTTVVAVDGQAASHGTPRWMLPSATILAVLISGFLVVALIDAGNQPLTDTQRDEFVAGCESSPSGQFVDCECLLGQLQSGGYDSVNSLRGVLSDAQAEADGGTQGGARTAVAVAVNACRR